MSHKERIIREFDNFRSFFVELNPDLDGKNSEEIFNIYFYESPEEIEVLNEDRVYLKRNFRLKSGVSHLLPQFFFRFSSKTSQ